MSSKPTKRSTNNYRDHVNDELQYAAIDLAARIELLLANDALTYPEDPSALYTPQEPITHRATGARLPVRDRYDRWDYQITIIARRKTEINSAD